ncbi:MAG: enoyl-CoA hydratase/isomerase family protein [Gammaproteobacteria bacterium]|nr:enoyl-CoA hydratase/isomerase family protein [Gammaproteobacteria bacterium]MCW5584257.1 enoyl-CoA hydratase/isomerase family protein [Gammaproteobacteria bacterium]
MTGFVLLSRSENIVTVTLNRPDKRNAMNGSLIAELLQILKMLANDDSRVVIIEGSGDSFCAGGDIAWMQEIASGSEEKNYEDAQLLADLLYALYTFPKPTIALAHGVVLGGGLGLLAAADIAIAAKSAQFGLPEVKIGIAPSIISPYVIAAIGERLAHYYFLTGERFNADEASQFGLIHQITADDALMNAGIAVARILSENSSQALRAAKQLIRCVSKQKISKELTQETAEHLAELRTTTDAKEGLHAFLAKRKPKWK